MKNKNPIIVLPSEEDFVSHMLFTDMLSKVELTLLPVDLKENVPPIEVKLDALITKLPDLISPPKKRGTNRIKPKKKRK